MRRIVRVLVYCALYAPFVVLAFWYQGRGHAPPRWLKLAIYVTGLMLSVAVVESF